MAGATQAGQIPWALVVEVLVGSMVDFQAIGAITHRTAIPKPPQTRLALFLPPTTSQIRSVAALGDTTLLMLVNAP